MREWLAIVTEYAVLAIDALALLVIAAGTMDAVIRGLKPMFSTVPDREHRAVWLDYGRWLVAGLTFQLAADIIETSVTADWEGIGRLAAIAVIRTFLNFFLERDLAEVRTRQNAREIRNEHPVS